MVASATFVAALALIEYLSSVALAQYITIPGLQAKDDAAGLEARGAGIRVASTTTHYIELAAFLALALPFAIHVARFGSLRSRRWGMVAALVIAGGIGASISRTGVLAVVLMFLVLVPVWTWRARHNILCTTLALFAVMAAASAMQAASVEKIGARVLRRPVGPSPARERTPTRERDTMPVIPVAGVIVLAMCLLAAYRAGGRG